MKIGRGDAKGININMKFEDTCHVRSDVGALRQMREEEKEV